MNQVSRSNSLNIPKKLDTVVKELNSSSDELSVRKAIKNIEGKDLIKQPIINSGQDKDLDIIDKIPTNASELMVITVVKKLCAYTICVTEKSPKKFRGVFVNRMQNYLLDALECLLEANFIRMDSNVKKDRRKDLQQNAIIKLKMLGYVAMLAAQVNCILPKQYKQISMQAAQAINLTVAWKKSDDERWKKINKGF